VDCNLYFFDHKVSIPVMFAVLVGSVVILLALYILLNLRKMQKAGR